MFDFRLKIYGDVNDRCVYKFVCVNMNYIMCQKSRSINLVQPSRLDSDPHGSGP